MTIEHLPRPWLLAALTGLEMTDLVVRAEDARPGWRAPHGPPRPPLHRRRPREASREPRPRPPVEAKVS